MRNTKIGVVIHTSLRDQLFSREDQARLSSYGQVAWTESAAPITSQEGCAILKDCEIGIGSWGTPRPDEIIMAACPQLRLWEHAAGTVKHMFGPHLEGRDLTIGSCAPAIAECVAQMCVGEIIVGVKRVLENAAANRIFRAPPPANSRNLCSCTVGVIGASEVGKNVIRLLRPFECSILLYDPFVSEAQAGEMGVRLCRGLTELCAASHAVTLHTPSLSTTKGLVGAQQFKAMRDDCVFVNTSRGDCIDEAALIAELERGRLLAFIDVTSPEPAALDSPLRRLPNVVLSSHIAGGKDFKIGRQAVDDVAAFLGGGRPRFVVTKEMLDRVA